MDSAEPESLARLLYPSCVRFLTETAVSTNLSLCRSFLILTKSILLYFSLYYLVPRNLTAWANEGVLLLNTALTVRNGNAGSHSKKGWETFTARVIDVVDKYGGANLGEKSGVGRGIVFLAWGNWAAKCVEKLDKVCCHLLVTGTWRPATECACKLVNDIFPSFSWSSM